MDTRSGTYVVAAADEEAAELRDVDTGQVLGLAAHPDLAAGDVVAGTLAPTDALGASWELVEMDERYTVEVSRSDEAPTRQVRRAAADQVVGTLTRIERAGTGEVHVIAVPEGGAADAVADLLADEADLVARAARLGVGRVEVRFAEETGGDVGVVSVRYLP